MRGALLTAVLILGGCEAFDQAAKRTPAAMPADAAGSQRTCRPTFAGMVPPQVVMDIIIGGASPRPSPPPSRDAWAATGNWIGNSALWVSLPVDGVFSRKYSKLWMIPLVQGPIAITGRQLDGAGAGTFTGTASDSNIGSSVTFSTPGCWELVYRLADEELRFTMLVAD
jgi:hypothetical protein